MAKNTQRFEYAMDTSADLEGVEGVIQSYAKQGYQLHTIMPGSFGAWWMIFERHV